MGHALSHMNAKEREHAKVVFVKENHTVNDSFIPIKIIYIKIVLYMFLYISFYIYFIQQKIFFN